MQLLSHLFSFFSIKKYTFLLFYFFIQSIFLFFPHTTFAVLTDEECEAKEGETLCRTVWYGNACKDGEHGIDSCTTGSLGQARYCCRKGTNPNPILTSQKCQEQGGVCKNADGPADCPATDFKLGECSDKESAEKYCCKTSPLPAELPTTTTNASFDYTPLEPIPGTEGMDTSTLKGFLEGLFLFVLWSAGIAALFMLVIGGFWYMTSAGNTSRVTEAKNIIANALWGLVIVLITWLILYVINPDLVRIDLSSLEALFIEGKVSSSYPQKKGVVGPGGSGTCGKATTSGNCSISNMQQCSAWNTEAASRVCLFESSGGNAFAESGSDKCADGSSFSFGLFQINIIANGEKLNGCDPNQVFKKYDGSPLGSSRGNNGGVLEYCTNSKGIRYVCKWNCKVVDTNMYNVCKQAAFDINQNISVACSLYRSGGWKPWPVTKKICNL